MKIDLIPADQWRSIDQGMWKTLSEVSVYPNPFYERWCLGPAIDHLAQGLEVYIACVYDDGKLKVLCPVEINKPYYFMQQLEVWRHDHCSLSSPLIENIKDLPDFLTSLLIEFNYPMLRVSNHPKVQVIADTRKC